MESISQINASALTLLIRFDNHGKTLKCGYMVFLHCFEVVMVIIIAFDREMGFLLLKIIVSEPVQMFFCLLDKSLFFCTGLTPSSP